MSKNNDYTDYTSFGEKWGNSNPSNGSSPKNDFTKNTETSSGIFGNQTNDFIQSQVNKSVGSNVNDNMSSGQDDMTLERTRDYVNNFVNKHTGNPIDNGSSSSNQNNGYSPTANYGANPVDAYVPKSSNYTRNDAVNPTVSNPYENYGNNNLTAKSGFSGNNGSSPTFVTFDNANNYASFSNNNDYNYGQVPNWNYTANSSNDINEPIKVAQPQSKPIYNYQADNYSNGPFGNMNNAYGGQNLLLNPNMFAGRMGEASYFEKGLHLTDRFEETFSDRQGQHTDRGVGTVKGGVAQTIAAMPINEVVNLYRQGTKQTDVRNYYNTNNIADNYKVQLGSKVNSAEATKKYNDYVAKCTQHGAKPMEYDKFLDAGARGEKIDIKDSRGVNVDKIDLSDSRTRNMFANAKLEVSSSENMSKVSTKYREYVSKCNSHGVKAIDYDKFLNKGAKGSVINIKDKNGNILDKVDLSDNKTRNVFADAKIETAKFQQIAHRNNTVENYGHGKTSNYDFNQMRQKNYEQLNRKMKLDGFKGTDKQMKMLRAKDRKLDKNNMFKDLSDADIKEIEDFVETNGANLGVFNSRAVNSQSAKGRSLVANKLMDDRTGDGFRTRYNDDTFVMTFDNDFDYELMEKLFNDLHSKYQMSHNVIIILNNTICNTLVDYIDLCEDIEKQANSSFYILNNDDLINFSKILKIKKELEDIANQKNFNDERVLVYCQPILDTKLNKFTTAESLMRLKLDGLGIIYPDVFIPLAEKNNNIHILTCIILNKVCKFIENNPEITRISVNFSMYEITNPKFYHDIYNIISKYHFDLNKLGFV